MIHPAHINSVCPHNTAVGIWITPAISDGEPTVSHSLIKGSSPSSRNPSITLFGSTNLNSRSANLDTELSFLLETRSPVLQDRLGEEVKGLWKDAEVVNEDVWFEQGRKVGGVSWRTRALVSIVGHML